MNEQISDFADILLQTLTNAKWIDGLKFFTKLKLKRRDQITSCV